MKVLREKWKFDNWENWRWKFLYQLDVHDVLYANYGSLFKLH